MTVTPRITAQLLAMTLGMGLVVLVMVAQACAPASPVGQDGEGQSPTSTPTAQDQKLDAILAGLVARHQERVESGARTTDPLLVEPAGAFIRVSRNIASIRRFLENNDAIVSTVRGSDNGYIIAEIPIALLISLAQRSEVTSVDSKVEAYLDPLVKIALARHEDESDSGSTAQTQGTTGSTESLETLAVEVLVPFTGDDGFFLGKTAADRIDAERISNLRRYLTAGGATITGGRYDYVSAQVPTEMLRELSEMPYVGAILDREIQVPGLTPAENAKISIDNLDAVVAAHESGIALPDDPNRRVQVRDGKVSLAIVMTGDDAEAVTANGRRIVQFLADNGGSGAIIDDAVVGSAVLAAVPVPLLKALVKRAEVRQIRLLPPGAGPAGPPGIPYGTNAGPEPQGAKQDGAERGNSAVSAVTSQGKDKHLATAWHNAGITGSDVKIGVIDTHFRRFSELMNDGELPSSSKVHIGCFTGQSPGYSTPVPTPSSNLADCSTNSSHGTATSEVIHDMAPDADI